MGKERRGRLGIRRVEGASLPRVEKGNTGLGFATKRGYLGQRNSASPLLGFSELLFCPTPI